VVDSFPLRFWAFPQDNFAVAFAAAAFACPTLREIDFTRNAIAGPGVIAICRALPGSSMVVVKLNNNKPPGTEAEAAASEAIKVRKHEETNILALKMTLT